MRTAGRFINLGECTGENCKQCTQKNVPKIKYTWIAKDESHNKIGLIDTGLMLGDQLCNIIKKDPDFRKYKILITRTGEQLKTKYLAKKGELSEMTSEETLEAKATYIFLKNKYLLDDM